MPRIALYQIIQEEKSKEESFRVIEEYMTNVVCVEMKRKYLLIEKLPLFSFVFKKIFIATVMKSDNWDAECVRNDKYGFKVIIHKCLWYDACVENGCPELTRAFCKCDDINYGSFHKIRFSRTGSIGMGSKMCDFQFSKKLKR
nr:L-2-amino-thiazoline-4-carboxylic acid hydrolase [Anaeromicropila herbilytica]